MALDRKQFAQTILRDQHKLAAFVLLRGAPHDVVDDVVQDTLAMAVERMEQFQDADHLRAWCRATARLKAMEYWRSQRRKPRAIDDRVLELLDPHFAALDAVDGADALDALRACMRSIPSPMRQVIDARYRDGLTGQKLADAVGRKFNTVYSTLSRAHAALADCVRRRLAGEEVDRG